MAGCEAAVEVVEPGTAASDAARLMRLLDYALPEELIAQRPAEHRDGARLLVHRRDGHDSAPRSASSWASAAWAVRVQEVRAAHAARAIRAIPALVPTVTNAPAATPWWTVAGYASGCDRDR